MSKDKSGKPAKKGMSMITVVIAVSVLMLAIGGGGAFAMIKMGMLGGPRAKEDNSPKLILKGETDPYAPKADPAKDTSGADVEGDGGSPYQTTYYSFSDDFTSNLKGSQSLIQVSIACSTHRDGRVIMWLKKHELALRSQILEVLADTDANDLDTMDGKQHLQKRLTAAINQELIQTEGFGGVDNVYFKTFLVQ